MMTKQGSGNGKRISQAGLFRLNWREEMRLHTGSSLTSYIDIEGEIHLK